MKVFKTEKGQIELYESYDKLIKQWGIEVVEKDIETKFGKTHVIDTEDKDKPVLLLFHGVGDNSAMMWIFNIKELAENFRIIAVDAIGGAGKSVPNKNYGKSFSQTEWIIDLLDKLEIQKAHAAGVSYGCYLVQHLKIEIPHRIDKIVGMSGTISAKGSKSVMMRMMKAMLPEALFPTEKNMVKLLKKLTGPDYSKLTNHKELMNHWRLMLRNFNNASMSYHKINKFEKEKFIEIRDDSLFFIGDCDILSYYPGSLDIMDELKMNYKIIRNAGHVINHEIPDIINNHILTFLK